MQNKAVNLGIFSLITSLAVKTSLYAGLAEGGDLRQPPKPPDDLRSTPSYAQIDAI